MNPVSSPWVQVFKGKGVDAGGWGKGEDVVSFEKCKEFNVMWTGWDEKDGKVMGEHIVKTLFELHPYN